MGLRFRKLVNLGEGINVNISKSLPSVSFGGRGRTLNIGAKGVYANFGLPGTGFSYRLKVGGKSKHDKRTAYEQKLDAVKDLQEKVSIYNQGLKDGVEQHRYVEMIPGKHTIKSIGSLIGMKIETADEFLAGCKFGLLWQIALIAATAIGSAIYLLNTSKRPDAMFGAFVLAACVIGIFGGFCYLTYRKNIKNAPEHQKIADWATSGLNGDPKVMEELLFLALDKITWFRDVQCAFSIADQGHTAVVNIELPSINTMPDHILVVKKTAAAVEPQQLEPSAIVHNYNVHNHGIILRIVSMCFALLPTIETVICNGYAEYHDDSTGKTAHVCAITAAFDRKSWEQVKPASADPIKLFSHFKHNKNAKGVTPLSEVVA